MRKIPTSQARPSFSRARWVKTSGVEPRMRGLMSTTNGRPSVSTRTSTPNRPKNPCEWSTADTGSAARRARRSYSCWRDFYNESQRTKVSGEVCDARSVRRQSHGYLPSRRASPPTTLWHAEPDARTHPGETSTTTPV